jgi:hypothetical protein
MRVATPVKASVWRMFYSHDGTLKNAAGLVLDANIAADSLLFLPWRTSWRLARPLGYGPQFEAIVRDWRPRLMTQSGNGGTSMRATRMNGRATFCDKAYPPSPSP